MAGNIESLESKQRWMRECKCSATTDVALPSASFSQRHYTVQEIAEMWNLGPDAVRKLFEEEPGVLVFGDVRGSRSKRRYVTLRIPEHVVERVYRRQAMK